MKIPYYRLNTEDLLTTVGINFNFCEEKFEIIDYFKENTLNTNEVTSVYFRRPKLPIIKKSYLSNGENNIVTNEITFTLEGLYKILLDKFWVSSVFSIREAENKIYQLILAKKLGFDVPPSIVTTDTASAKRFVSQNDETIVKPIKTGLIKNVEGSQVIFTSLIKDEQKNSLFRVESCPTYLQEKISKIADLRITVVGDKVFSAKIFSQEFEDSKIDWRKGSSTLKYERVKIPEYIECKCIELVRYLKLNFGAIDLVLDQQNRYIFLEINPNGQWAWIEEKLGYNISGEIINLLVKGKNYYED